MLQKRFVLPPPQAGEAQGILRYLTSRIIFKRKAKGMTIKMKIKFPDYDNCIAGITSSVLKHYGAACNIKSLPVLDERLKNDYKNIVVILFDGLGSNVINAHLDGNDFFLKNTVCDISSVFPPTTAAATTSLLSGLLPIEHAWLGWSLHFDELDKNVCLFTNTIHDTPDTPAADYNVAERYIPYENICVKIQKATGGEVKAFGVYPFGGNKTESAEKMCGTVKSLCEKNGRKFIYAYWTEPDSTMHRFGVNHASVREQVKRFSRLTEQLCKDLTDTLVIVTADHGMTDVNYKFLTDYPHISDLMLRPRSIESRAANFFIKEEKKSYFKQAFNSEFGSDFKLYSKEEILKEGLFGDMPAHPRIERFLGDYIAVAIGKTCIENIRPLQRDIFKAMHAGLTEDEMAVPLIII